MQPQGTRHWYDMIHMHPAVLIANKILSGKQVSPSELLGTPPLTEIQEPTQDSTIAHKIAWVLSTGAIIVEDKFLTTVVVNCEICANGLRTPHHHTRVVKQNESLRGLVRKNGVSYGMFKSLEDFTEGGNFTCGFYGHDFGPKHENLVVICDGAQYSDKSDVECYVASARSTALSLTLKSIAAKSIYVKLTKIILALVSGENDEIVVVCDDAAGVYEAIADIAARIGLGYAFSKYASPTHLFPAVKPDGVRQYMAPINPAKAFNFKVVNFAQVLSYKEQKDKQEIVFINARLLKEVREQISIARSIQLAREEAITAANTYNDSVTAAISP